MHDVPRSIEEIYKISNRNRKRNKEKRKLKEESTKDNDKAFSPVRLGHEAPDASPHPTKRQKTEVADQEFMRSIGWASGGQSTKPVATEESSSATLASSSNSVPAEAPIERRSTSTKARSKPTGVNAENFTPFDYSGSSSSSGGFPTRGLPRGLLAHTTQAALLIMLSYI